MGHPSFGSAQGSASVWLGTSPGVVTTWSDTQIVATVGAGSTTGVAQVQRGGLSSNSVTFSIDTPIIASVSPTSGIVGTQVTVSGSGFGAAQGTGYVWLGTAYGTVTSWSDTQVVATVAAGSNSGSVQVMQNGVLSAPVSFDVGTPHVTGVTPSAGSPGTAITISGAGFGTTQGSGSVWLGSSYGTLVSWSDTQIVADVASGSQSGTVRVLQNGQWSNSTNFTVTTSGTSTSVLIVPNLMNMVVGDTRTIQAVDATGAVQTGLTWASSDSNIASLSTDDPPIITAVATGHVTITAGDGSADLTIYAGPTLPDGTIKWSAPGDGSGVTSIVPAVPSETGVADVFAFMASGNVQALTSDGTVAWTASVGTANAVPDFQGGLVVADSQTVKKLDGLTGQPNPAYTLGTPSSGNAPVAIHTDGTIFVVDGASLVGLDPATGVPKFSIPMEHSISDLGPYCEFQQINHYDSPPSMGQMIIAGDGFAYLPYLYASSSSSDNLQGCNRVSHSEAHLRLLRVGTDGSSSEITLSDWASDSSYSYLLDGSELTIDSQTGPEPATYPMPYLITNADTGVVATWKAGNQAYCSYRWHHYVTDHWEDTISGCVGDSNQLHLATITSGSPAGDVTLIVGQYDYLQPVLQREDGTFIGNAHFSNGPGDAMAAFDAAGNVKWALPGNYQPAIATDDGGVVANLSAAGSTNVDQYGNITGQKPSSPTQSWVGNEYRVGSIDQIVAVPTDPARTFGAFVGGSLSGSGTSIDQVMSRQPQGDSKQLPDLDGSPFCVPLPRDPLVIIIPTCGNINAIELLTDKSPDFIFQNLIQTFLPVAGQNNLIMTFTNPGGTPANINVTGSGQKLTIALAGWQRHLQDAFSVVTERFDSSAHVISAVTLQGHPLAGWRYWTVYSVGTNDVVVETGAYDQPGPGPLNYAGYYVAHGDVSKGWQQYMLYVKKILNAQEGTNLHALGGISLRQYPWVNGSLLQGYWDYQGDFTGYILNNVCQSTVCN